MEKILVVTILIAFYLLGVWFVVFSSNKVAKSIMKRYVRNREQILNEETVSEADKKLCPECRSPYIGYTPHEHYHCASCDHDWT